MQELELTTLLPDLVPVLASRCINLHVGRNEAGWFMMTCG